MIHNEIDEITRKIATLDSIRLKLEDDLVKLQEDELELDDECACAVFLLCTSLNIHPQWRVSRSA